MIENDLNRLEIDSELKCILYMKIAILKDFEVLFLEENKIINVKIII